MCGRAIIQTIISAPEAVFLTKPSISPLGKVTPLQTVTLGPLCWPPWYPFEILEQRKHAIKITASIHYLLYSILSWGLYKTGILMKFSFMNESYGLGRLNNCMSGLQRWQEQPGFEPKPVQFQRPFSFPDIRASLDE